MSCEMMDKVKDLRYQVLVNYLEQLEPKNEDKVQVLYVEIGGQQVKQVDYLGKWTRWRREKHFKNFDRYSFNEYTERKGLMWKYKSKGIFKRYQERG